MLRVVLLLFLIFNLFLGANDSSQVEPPLIKLNFTKAVNHFSIKPLEKKTIYTIIDEQNVNAAKAFLYKSAAESDIYGGLLINGHYYDLGIVSMSSSSKELYSISAVKLFNKSLIRFSGVLGANYARSAYIEIVDNKAYPFLDVDGSPFEVDLDEDQIKEIVTSVGTAIETSVFRLIDGEVYVANLNESMGVQTVVYRNEINQFEIYQDSKQKLYKYLNGSLQLL